MILIVYYGDVVSSSEPMEKLGLYWGYTVRVAEKFEDIFEQTNYSDPYDLKIGISQDHGELSDTVDFEPY